MAGPNPPWISLRRIPDDGGNRIRHEPAMGIELMAEVHDGLLAWTTFSPERGL
jgi:hypothetical protein